MLQYSRRKTMKMDLNTIKNIPPWDWPEEASGLFLKVLRDSDADDSERIVAAELAGDMVAIDDDLAEELLSIAGNENEPVRLRRKATISLGPVLEEADTGDFDDPDEVPISEETFCRIKETLHQLYTDGDVPKKIRRAALEGVCTISSGLALGCHTSRVRLRR
jgi:hypothetical protein